MAYDEGLTGDDEQDSILGGAAIGGLIGGAGGAGVGAVVGASREAPKGSTGSGGNLTNENAEKYAPQHIEPEESETALQQRSAGANTSNDKGAGDMIGAPVGELVGDSADDVSIAGSANHLPGSNAGTGAGGATVPDTSQLPDADSDQESHTGDAIENSETGAGMMGNASG